MGFSKIMLLSVLTFTNVSSSIVTLTKATDPYLEDESAERHQILPERFTQLDETVDKQESDLEEILTKKLKDLQKSYSSVKEQRDQVYFTLEDKKIDLKNASLKIDDLTSQLKRAEAQRDETWFVYQKANTRIEQLEEIQKEISKELTDVKTSRDHHEKARNETWEVYLQVRTELTSALSQLENVRALHTVAEIEKNELHAKIMEKDKDNENLANRIEHNNRVYKAHVEEIQRLTTELKHHANQTQYQETHINNLTRELTQITQENQQARAQLANIDELLGPVHSFRTFLMRAQRQGIQTNDIEELRENYTPLQKLRIQSLIGVRILKMLIENPDVNNNSLIIDVLNSILGSPRSEEDE